MHSLRPQVVVPVPGQACGALVLSHALPAIDWTITARVVWSGNRSAETCCMFYRVYR